MSAALTHSTETFRAEPMLSTTWKTSPGCNSANLAASVFAEANVAWATVGEWPAGFQTSQNFNPKCAVVGVLMDGLGRVVEYHLKHVLTWFSCATQLKGTSSSMLSGGGAAGA